MLIHCMSNIPLSLLKQTFCLSNAAFSFDFEKDIKPKAFSDSFISGVFREDLQ